MREARRERATPDHDDSLEVIEVTLSMPHNAIYIIRIFLERSCRPFYYYFCRYFAASRAAVSKIRSEDRSIPVSFDISQFIRMLRLPGDARLTSHIAFKWEK